MKSRIYVKQHANVQFAHLYEHLFASQFNEYLFENGLIKWLDYSLNGATFEQGGIITLEYKAYTNRANAFFNDLHTFNINTDRQLVRNALKQITVEDGYELAIESDAALIAELQAIDLEQWQDIDNIAFIDTSDLEYDTVLISQTERGIDIATVEVTLEIDATLLQKLPSAAPPFAVISKIIFLTLVARVAARTGSYFENIQTEQAGSIIVGNLYFIDRPEPADIKAISTDIQTSFKQIYTAGFVDKLEQYFLSISYNNTPGEAPDFEELLVNSQGLMGSKGWKDFSASKQTEAMLEHITLGVRYQDDSVTSPLIR